MVVKFTSVEDDELREYCFQAFEAFIRRYKQTNTLLPFVQGNWISLISSPSIVTANLTLTTEVVHYLGKSSDGHHKQHKFHSKSQTNKLAHNVKHLFYLQLHFSLQHRLSK